jgi:N-acetylmuramic acid 6-phosphate etherase
MDNDYDRLPTELSNPKTRDLDLKSPRELVSLIHQQDVAALEAVGRASAAIAEAVEHAASALAQGGRLVYVGAGTSGRLGVLDAAECPPTFGTAPEQVIGLIAGGPGALTRAVEGAEDSDAQGRDAIQRRALGANDVLVGLSASGSARYVRAALAAAKARGCHTVVVSCAPPETLAPLADTVIALDIGSETLTGSTRMKSGLAQKAVLHTISTAAMVRIGKVYDNLMVDVQPTNRKLRRRAIRLVEQLTCLDSEQAASLLRKAKDSPKLAAVMHHQGVDSGKAMQLLAAHDGHLRPLINEPRHAKRSTEPTASAKRAEASTGDRPDVGDER